MDEAVEDVVVSARRMGWPRGGGDSGRHTRLMRRARDGRGVPGDSGRDRLAQRLVELEAENRRAWAMVRKFGDSDG